MYLLGLHQIRPEAPHRVKHGRRPWYRVRCHGTSTAVGMPRIGRKLSSRLSEGEPQVCCNESFRCNADLELWAQRQPAEADPLDILPGDALVAPEAQDQSLVVDDDLGCGRGCDGFPGRCSRRAPAPVPKTGRSAGSLSESVGALAEPEAKWMMAAPIMRIDTVCHPGIVDHAVTGFELGQPQRSAARDQPHWARWRIR